MLLWRAVLVALGSGVAFGQSSNGTTSLFQIEIPSTLYKTGGYRHKEAMFGAPKYGVTLTQKLYYSNSNMCDDGAVASGGLPAGDWVAPFLLMVDRGECTFVKKVRNAQKLGASGVIVADNRCVCGDPECESGDVGLGCETEEPIMADDGSGADISIPAILLWKSDADKIKTYLKTETNPVVQGKLEWSIPHPDNRVEWELWMTSVDQSSMDFLLDFNATVFALGQHQYFTPHFYTWNGTAYGCPNSDRCGTLCSNQGRYCAPDPDGRSDVGLSGKDVVVENLRRTCVWKLYGGADAQSATEKGVGRVWWRYLTNFTQLCGTAEMFTSNSCVEAALVAAGANPREVTQCMEAAGGTEEGKNTILEHELGELQKKSIYVVPECIINNQAVWGALSTGNVLETICHGYSAGDEPGACDCQTLAANTKDARYKACLEDSVVYNNDPGITVKDGSKKKSVAGTAGYMPWWGVFLLVLSIVVVMLLGALFYWKKTQQQMRDQVRGILAEYMPLEDVGPTQQQQQNALHSTPGLSIQA